MEIFKIPTGESVKTIAIPMHPLEFWIENYGILNGYFDPAAQKEISLYDANGMLNFSAVDQHRANGKVKKKSPTEGLNFISLFERCGTNNEGVVLAPCSIPTRTVRMIINHVSEQALDLHVATDEMHISLETNRGEVNVRISGVSKLAVAKQNRRPFNYSILQPGTQIVEEYMQRSSQLMQYLIDNRNAFQDDMEYWGVKGDQLKK